MELEILLSVFTEQILSMNNYLKAIIENFLLHILDKKDWVLVCLGYKKNLFNLSELFDLLEIESYNGSVFMQIHRRNYEKRKS